MTHHDTNDIKPGQRWQNRFESDGVAGQRRILEVVKLHRSDATAKQYGGPRVRAKNVNTGRELLYKPEVFVSRWEPVPTTTPTSTGNPSDQASPFRIQ